MRGRRRGFDDLTICRRGYETWAFKDNASFTFSYIRGGVVGGSPNIFLGFASARHPDGTGSAVP